MLRNSLIAASLLCLVAPAQANSGTDAERIVSLEAQVRALTAQVERLKSQNETLLTQIAGIRGILGVAPEQTGAAAIPTAAESEILYCLERLDDARRIKDRLVSAGFLEGHPDMLRISARVEEISAECAVLRETPSR